MSSEGCRSGSACTSPAHRTQGRSASARCMKSSQQMGLDVHRRAKNCVHPVPVLGDSIPARLSDRFAALRLTPQDRDARESSGRASRVEKSVGPSRTLLRGRPCDRAQCAHDLRRPSKVSVQRPHAAVRPASRTGRVRIATPRALPVRYRPRSRCSAAARATSMHPHAMPVHGMRRTAGKCRRDE